MAVFRYEASDVNGKVLRGAMEAADAAELSRRLAERGYRLVSAHNPVAAAATPVRTAAPSPPPSPGFALNPGVPPQALGLFFRQLTALLHAGHTPALALGDLAGRTAERRLAAAAREMGAAAAKGTAMSGQMARYPGVFPAHVIGLIQAGETGGFLPFACEEAALGAEQDAALRQGMWLPKFLIWQSVWTVLLMVPLFPRIMTEGIAAYVRAVLTWSIPVGIGLHLAVLVLCWVGRQPMAAGARDRLWLMLPLARRLARARALAAFTRVLRRLLQSGISPEPAYVGAARAVPNSVLSNRLLAGVRRVRAGEGIDAALSETGLMHHDPLQLLITGQRSGQWTEMLEQVTTYYQEEAGRATDAVRSAQKRAGVLITIISSGYVFIAATQGYMSTTMEWIDTFFKE